MIRGVFQQPVNAAIAKENLADKASARVMDAHNLDVDDGSVDIVCCSGVLHHLDTESAARSWSRKLKATGKVIMLEPMAMNPVIALYRKFTPSMRTKDEHPLLPKDIKILRKYFKDVELNGYVLTSLFSVIWTFFPNSEALKRTTQKNLESIDKWLLAKIPSLVYFCWTCVITISKPKTSVSENFPPSK